MRTFLTGLVSLLSVGAAIYAGLCLLLYWRQENAIFFPVQNDPTLRREHESARIEIPSHGQTLEGWSVENPQAATSAVILYFGGNAEDVLYTASEARYFDAQRIVAVNYRGYGGSSGEPGQAALYDDAIAVYDFVVSKGTQPDRIVVMGRSLGSAMATMLAATRPVAGAILITPFDSLRAVGAAHYPIFPVDTLLRHPFPSDEWAPKALAPALFLAGSRDSIVPATHAQRLRDLWGGRKQWHLLDAGHNDIHRDPGYYALINSFLGSLPP